LILKKLALLILLLFPAVSAVHGDVVGTVLNVTDSNGIFINITESKIVGLEGIVQIILAQPMSDLRSFQGKELRFDLLGRDILGRPVCDAYLGEVRIQDIPEEIDSSSWFVSGEGQQVERSSSPYEVSFRDETGYSEGAGLSESAKREQRKINFSAQNRQSAPIGIKPKFYPVKAL
jgi:hypothetical protein